MLLFKIHLVQEAVEQGIADRIVGPELHERLALRVERAGNELGEVRSPG